MADVFISYSRRDSAIAERVERELSDCRITVWRDRSRLVAGDQWTKLLGEEISTSRLMLLLWSKDAKDSHHVDFEWGTALAQKKIILPFCLDNTDPPPSLSRLHHVAYESEKVTAAAVAAALGYEGPRPAERKRTSRGVLAAATLGASLAVALLFWRWSAAQVQAPSQTVQLELNAGAIGAKMQIDQRTQFDSIPSRNPPIALTLGKHEIVIIRDQEPPCVKTVPIDSQTRRVPLDCF